MRSVVISAVSFALTAAIGAASGALGASYYLRSRPSPPALPQIRVVDMRRIVETIARDPTLDEAGRHARTQEWSDVISAFIAEQTREGIIVLDGSAVLRAPAEVYIDPGGAR